MILLQGSRTIICLLAGIIDRFWSWADDHRASWGRMRELLLQVLIVVTFGAFCFGCGYLIAFIVTRNQWRDEMIKRGVARYDWQTGKWEWGDPPKDSRC